jgi:hypothetical protein
MKIKYTETGEPGKTCADCKHFEEDENLNGIGKCFGYEVKASGSCNLFEPKKREG